MTKTVTVPTTQDQIVEVFSSSNRVGKFQVLHEKLASGQERPMLLALMSLCVVLSVDEHESGRGKEYIAASDLFQPLAEGEEVPQYRIECQHDGAFENPEHEAKRLNSGAFGFVAIRQHILRVPPATFAQHMNMPGNIH